MLRIQRALLAELISVFVLITGIVTGAVFGGFTVRFITEGGDALGSELMLELIPKIIPIALAYSIPFAWLAAVALVMGRWVSDNECTALKSAGVHLRTIVVPVAALGCLLGVAGMLFNGYEVPWTHREVRSSLKDYLPRFLASLRGADRSISLSTGRISWERYDPERDEFVAAVIDRRDKEGHLQTQAIVRRLALSAVNDADDGLGLHLLLKDAHLVGTTGGEVEFNRSGPNASFPMGRAERIAASTLFNKFFTTSRFMYRPKDMVVPELFYVQERGGVRRGSVQEAEIAMNGRLALGASPFFLGLFALAVSLLLPPSGRRVRDFLICFLPAVVMFFLLYLGGPGVATRGTLPPWLAMWAPNLLLAATSGVLLHSGLRR